MDQSKLIDLEKLEDSLWEAADHLRANSKLTSTEYCMPVLGIIFLRHATNRYNAALLEIEADQKAGRIPKRPLTKADFLKRRSLMLPKEARYDELLKLPKDSDLGAHLVEAMNGIERDFEPLLNQLPKDYNKFENRLLEDLLRIFDSEVLRTASGDVFGRINEYFLMKFAIEAAQDNGEFFTPPSLVQMIVNVIEPEHGIVLDPACGSGGMFVQSSHFIERIGQETSHRVTFYGQEFKTSNLRLAKMNLAVHGLEGDIKEANTFYDDLHRLHGKCDFVMANPPFNVDMVDAERIKNDCRLPFGLPGVNKDKKVSNGNYLWISYFWSYLNPKGRAGFVMSSQASSAGHGEAEVRRKIVETGDVDVMISIRSGFFYTRTVPCELWHFDRDKPADRKNKVLMLDARNVAQRLKNSRKIWEFSPEQMRNLTSIVWLYRGQTDRFLSLVHAYFKKVCIECEMIPDALEAFDKTLESVTGDLGTFAKSAAGIDKVPGEKKKILNDAMSELKEALSPYENDCGTLIKGISTFRKKYEDDLPKTNAAQQTARKSFDPASEHIRGLVKQIELLHKLLVRVGQISAELAEDEKVAEYFDRRVMSKKLKQLDEERKNAVEQLRLAVYFHRQLVWLQDRFPDAKFADVPGLCKVVGNKDIAAADWSLTPGRYVGVAPQEIDEDFDFEETIRNIHSELAVLNDEAAKLAKAVQENLEEMGI